MKNILLLVPMLHQGGFERICALTAKLLKDKHRITVAIFSDADMIYDVGDVELINLHLGSRPSKMGKLINVAKRVKAVKKLKKEKNIDLTYSFGITANIVNALSKVQDVIWLGIRAYGDLDSKRNMKLFAKKADALVCCTKIMEEDIAEQYRPKKTFTLYNPCDVEHMQVLAKENVAPEYENFFHRKSVIMGMRREDDVKGFWHLIKAFSLVKKEYPDVRLMIVGEGEFTEYKRLAEELGIAEDCAFPGVQKNPFPYLTRASLFVMTSVSEGFPNSLIEAMAVGIPALSVNCKTGPAEILAEDFRAVSDCHQVYDTEYGVLLPIINPVKNMNAAIIEREEQIIAEEMMKLIKDKKHLEIKKRAALKRGKDFSLKRYTECILEEFEKYI